MSFDGVAGEMEAYGRSHPEAAEAMAVQDELCSARNAILRATSRLERAREEERCARYYRDLNREILCICDALEKCTAELDAVTGGPL